MQTYIALLRGINVSGQRIIKMVDLRLLLDKMGFEDVVTYIQSGNAVFKTSEKKTALLEEKIKKGIAKTFGFDVPVLIKTKTDLVTILNESPFKNAEDIEANRVYYVLLKSEPEPDTIANMSQEDYPNELFRISKNCVYLNCIYGAGKAKLTNTIIERKLKVGATSRNHRTMMKLVALCD